MPGLPSRPLLQAFGLAPGARRRAWAVLLALAMAFASLAYVAHSHEADAPAIQKKHCSFCGAFDRGSAPPPASITTLPRAPLPSFDVARLPEPEAQLSVRTACQPRAPPILQA